eukprot:TRINITY_DN716_c0_g1_i5.p1 TRINITY_DN716_c0_g1~~TRINITY_DN716_c0_g1_i5.p1  ORF type:complete len:1394 (-),score=301.59 TRINITY_DN716_c0_g1_i5:27-4208(-)
MEQNSENFLQRNPQYQNYQNPPSQSGLDYQGQGINGRNGMSNDPSMQLPGLSPNLNRNPGLRMMGNMPSNQGMSMNSGSPGMGMSSSPGGMQMSGGSPGMQMSGGSPGMSMSGGSPGMQMSGGSPGMQMSGGSPGMSMSGGSPGMQMSGSSSGLSIPGLPGMGTRQHSLPLSSNSGLDMQSSQSGMRNQRGISNQGLPNQSGMGISRQTPLSSGLGGSSNSSSLPHMSGGKTGSGGLSQNLSRNPNGLSALTSMSSAISGSLNSGMMSSISGRTGFPSGSLSSLPGRADYSTKLGSDGYSYPSQINTPGLKESSMSSLYTDKMMLGKSDSYGGYDQYGNKEISPGMNPRIPYGGSYGYNSPDNSSSMYSASYNYPYMTGAPDLRANPVSRRDASHSGSEDDMYSDDDDVDFFGEQDSGGDWKPSMDIEEPSGDKIRRSSRARKVPDRFEETVKPEIELGTIESVLTHFYFSRGTLQPLHDVNPFIDDEPPNAETRYLVKWVGWSHFHNSWNTSDELKGSKGIKKLSTYRTQINQEKNILKLGTEEDKERYFVKKELHLRNLLKYSVPEKILNTKVVQNESNEEEILYLVKWCNLPHIGSTWESKEVIDNFPELKKDEETFSFKFYGYPGQEKNELVHFSENEALKGNDHRIESVNWVLDNWYKGLNSVVAYENGLEKEIMGISVLQTIIQKNEINGPFLIITSTNKLTMWENLLNEFLPDVTFLNFSGDPSSRRVMLTHSFYKVKDGVDLPKFQILLTDYNTIVKDKYYLVQFSWNFNIYDDAHILSYPESTIYSTLRDIVSAGSLLLLNTLEVNSVMLSTMMPFVSPVSKDYNQFLNDHIHFKTRLIVNDQINLKSEKLIRVPVCDKQLTLVKHVLCSKFNDLNWGSRYAVQNILDDIIKICCSGHAILDSIDDFDKILEVSPKFLVLDRILDDNSSKKIIIISKYIEVLEMTQLLLDRKGMSYTKAFGNLDRVVKAEKEFANTHCVLISSSAMDLSLDLSQANMVISLDPYSNERQLEKCKIGKLNEVSLYRIITKNTSEEKVFDTLLTAKKQAYYQDYGTFFISEESRFILNKNTLTKVLQLYAQDIFNGNISPSFVGDPDVDLLLEEAEKDLLTRGSMEYYLERSEEEPYDVQYWNKVIPTSAIQSSVINLPKRKPKTSAESPRENSGSISEENEETLEQSIQTQESVSEKRINGIEEFTGIISPNLSSGVSITTNSEPSQVTAPVLSGTVNSEQSQVTAPVLSERMNLEPSRVIAPVLSGTSYSEQSQVTTAPVLSEKMNSEPSQVTAPVLSGTVNSEQSQVTAPVLSERMNLEPSRVIAPVLSNSEQSQLTAPILTGGIDILSFKRDRQTMETPAENEQEKDSLVDIRPLKKQRIIPENTVSNNENN